MNSCMHQGERGEKKNLAEKIFEFTPMHPMQLSHSFSPRWFVTEITPMQFGTLPHAPPLQWHAGEIIQVEKNGPFWPFLSQSCIGLHGVCKGVESACMG